MVRTKSTYKTNNKIARLGMVIGLLAASTALTSPNALAQVTPADSNTAVKSAGNGVPVVDIANPNSSGLSHNKYIDYNVGSQGLVLNNGTAAQFERQSQLAGAVQFNPNLTSSATTILNEVTSTNRSVLQGYTEVLGSSAEVIVANPNGITCNGCGFINTPRVTFATGVPQLSGDALTGYRVNSGDILITGNGLDASNQDYLGLFARSVELAGQVNADELDVIAGANDIDHATKTPTPIAGSGATPTYAIDSSALGGMYAGRIRLIATEDGAGVRALGDAAAGSGDFTLSASGKIEIGGAVSAAEDVSITTTASGDDAVLTSNSATISAGNDLDIDASSGEVHLQGGVLTASGDLSVSADSIDDDATVDATLADNNERYAAGDLTLDATGTIDVNGTSWGTAGILDIDANAVNISADGGTFFGDSIDVLTNGDIALGAAIMRAENNLVLTSTAGALSTSSGGTVKSAAGDITMTIAGTVNNAGTIAADGGDITADITGLLTNSGTIQSSGGSDYTFAAGVTITNAGEILAGDDLYMRAASTSRYTINNANLVQAGGLLYIKGYNNGDGVDLYTTTTYENDEFGVAQVSNAGRFMGQTGDIRTYVMNLSNGGGIITQGDLALRPVTLTMGGVDTRIIAAASGSGTGTFTFNSIDNYGLMFSGDDLTMTTNYITNRGGAAIAANGTLNITTKSGAYIFNYGDIYAGTELNLDADSIFNYGSGLITGYDLNFTLYDAFLNTGDIIADNNMVVSSAGIYNQVPGGDARFTQVTDHTLTSTGWSRDPSFLWPSGSAHNYYTETWVVSTDYTGAPPTRGAMLHAGNTMTLRDFGVGHNLGSIISAGTLNIGPASSYPTFTNESYDLSATYYTRTWRNTASCCHGYFGEDTYYYAYLDDTTSSYSTTIPFNSSTGSGFYANTFNASGFALVNEGSPYNEASTPTNPDMDSVKTILPVDVTIPTSPNGVFVANRDPNAQYLIETNPLYQVNSTFRGSDYMIETYGVDPEQIDRRLGDANYEAKLIREQVIGAGAAALIVNAPDEAAAMQTLMDNGLSEGQKLGLTIGKEPTADQLANLGSDMVWMVETNVGGERVLAPVVYLSAATKSQIVSGAVIQATNANLQLASLTNTGGTIIGSQNLNVTTDGNITNTSGMIKGGNVSLSSTNGSIINETYANTTGGFGNQQTDIGKIAGIQADGNFNLNAGQDITNLGAQMSAGGDASLNAGSDITFDTVVDNKSKATHSTSGGTFSGGVNSVTESSSTNIKSGLTVGGNLKSNSGGDTTFAGTDVNVGGNADLNTGGNLNILARNDSKSTQTKSSSGDSFGSGSSNTLTKTKTTNVGSSINIGGNLNTKSAGDTTIQGSDVNVTGNGSIDAGGNLNILDGRNTETTVASRSKSGFGQGDGAYGTDSAADLNYKSKSVASNLNFGGNADLKAGETLTIQGSNIETAGNLGLSGEDVQILEGRDIEINSTSRSKTGFGGADSFDLSKGGSSTSDGSSAGADANFGGSAGLTLGQINTTTTTRLQSNTVGSNIKSGGNLSINAGNDVTIRGSNVEGGGDVELNAKNVNIMAAQNIDQTVTTQSSTKVGMYLENQNNMGAGAGATAGGTGFDGNGSPNGNAGFAGMLSGQSGTTLDIARTNTTTTSVTDITHSGSTIRSHGNMKINAGETLTVHGSDVVSRKDMELNATDMQFLAADDMHIETTNSKSSRAGFYLDGNAGADIGANGQAQGASGDASGQGNANAYGGAGVYGSTTSSGSVQGTTTAQTSMIKADGNLTRNAKNNITDVGTQIVAAGDFNQTSETWDSRAAQDTTFSSESSRTDTAKAGMYGEANANASGQGGTNGFGKESDKGAGKGLQFGYNQTIDGKTSGSSTAVVSNIKAGGNLNTTTRGNASLEGTTLSSGGDTNLTAGSLDYKAAQNTTYGTEGGRVIDVDLKAGKKGGKLEGSLSQQNKNEYTSQAVTGGIYSKGNININTGGDANFEGTNLNAANDANVNAGGNVNFKAAQNTTMSSDSSLDVKGSLEASKNSAGQKGGSGEVSAEYGTSISRSSEAVTGSIKSGGNINISSGNDTTFEGTRLASAGDTNVRAGGDVNFNAAKDTVSESSKQAGGKVKLEQSPGDNGSTERGGEIEVSGGYSRNEQVSSTGGSVEAGGNLNVRSGRDVNLEGTNIETTGSTNLSAGRDVNFMAATDTTDASSYSGKLEGKGKKTSGGDNGNSGNNSGGQQGGSGSTEKEGGGELSISGEKSTSKTGGSINAGNINIVSGRNTTLEGTQTQTIGETNINAGGDVNLLAAKSTSVKGAVGGSASTSGGGLNQASVKTKTENQSVSMQSGGDVNINSGGITKMQATQIDTAGDANVNAQGGVINENTTDTEFGVGLDHGEASVTQQATSITQQNQKALIPQVNTLAEANTIEDQLKAARDRVKKDKSLTKDQRKEQLARIKDQEKALKKRIKEIKKQR